MKMKFEWHYKYVPDGQIEPDNHGRWAIDCYLFVNIDKALPKYAWCKNMPNNNGYLPINVATMVKKGTSNGVVPSTMHEYCVCIPSFENAGSFGMATEQFFYSNDIEELKSITEKNFEHIRTVFMNCELI